MTMDTIAEGLVAVAHEERPGLLAGDAAWTWAEVVAQSKIRADLVAGRLGSGPPHVCVLLGNVPEFCFWLGATALSGTVLVGGNSSHRGDELARDIAHTECQILVTDTAHLPLVEGLYLGPAIGKVATGNPQVLVVDSASYREEIEAIPSPPHPV